MYYSIGLNRDKKLNEMMKRVKTPKLSQDEECIYSCDDDYVDEFIDGFCDDVDKNSKCCAMKNLMKFDSKVVMFLGIGLAVGVLGGYLLRK